MRNYRLDYPTLWDLLCKYMTPLSWHWQPRKTVRSRHKFNVYHGSILSNIIRATDNPAISFGLVTNVWSSGAKCVPARLAQKVGPATSFVAFWPDLLWLYCMFYWVVKSKNKFQLNCNRFCLIVEMKNKLFILSYFSNFIPRLVAKVAD